MRTKDLRYIELVIICKYGIVAFLRDDKEKIYSIVDKDIMCTKCLNINKCDRKLIKMNKNAIIIKNEINKW